MTDQKVEGGMAGESWLVEVERLLDALDHDETLHEDTFRQQYTYDSESLGALLAEHRRALRAALIRLIESLRGLSMPRVWHC